MKYETCRDVGIDAQRVLHHHRSGEFERRKQEVACEGRTVKVLCLYVSGDSL